MVVEGESEEKVVAFHPLDREGFDLWYEACEVFGMGVEVERGQEGNQSHPGQPLHG